MRICTSSHTFQERCQLTTYSILNCGWTWHQAYPILAGEDIGIYGGAFGVTEGLLEEFGSERIKDTPISEDVIAGLAVGASMTGSRPIVEMQFSDFIVNIRNI